MRRSTAISIAASKKGWRTRRRLKAARQRAALLGLVTAIWDGETLTYATGANVAHPRGKNG